MRTFILLTLLAAALARPEAPFLQHGFTQQQQQPVYPSAAGEAPQAQQQQLPGTQQFVPNFAPITYSLLPSSAQSPPYAIQQINPPQLDSQTTLSLAAPLGADHLEDSYRTAHLLSSVQHERNSAGYPYASQQTAVHKHIYVHAPPQGFDEEDSIQLRLQQAAVPKQKHYKIVFIKAPSPPAIRAPVAAAAPQTEEKTLIYVLHKKPDSAEDVLLPAPAPTKPSKPEVYFIKYKTKKTEAPLYGPPALQEAQRSTDNAGLAEYAQDVSSAVAAAGTGAEQYQTAIEAGLLNLPPTTASDEAEAQKFAHVELPAQSYGVPENELPELQSLTAAGGQIVVPEERRLPPSAAYGPPDQAFLKKKK